jgi:hypothetical protein
VSMQDATSIAGSWLEWGQWHGLAAPHYVTLSVGDGVTNIGYQFRNPADVAAWAHNLGVDATTTVKDSTQFDRAIYKTGGYELECYAVTDIMPEPADAQADSAA